MMAAQNLIHISRKKQFRAKRSFALVLFLFAENKEKEPIVNSRN